LEREGHLNEVARHQWRLLSTQAICDQIVSILDELPAGNAVNITRMRALLKERTSYGQLSIKRIGECLKWGVEEDGRLFAEGDSWRLV